MHRSRRAAEPPVARRPFGRSTPLPVTLALFLLGLAITVTPVFLGEVLTPHGITMIAVGDVLWVSSFTWLWKATSLRPRRASRRDGARR
jgi:hypothetical protein